MAMRVLEILLLDEKWMRTESFSPQVIEAHSGIIRSRTCNGVLGALLLRSADPSRSMLQVVSTGAIFQLTDRVIELLQKEESVVDLRAPCKVCAHDRTPCSCPIPSEGAPADESRPSPTHTHPPAHTNPDWSDM